MQQQHVLPAWLLRTFGRRLGSRTTFAVYDKQRADFDVGDADEFMIEIDAHSTDIERSIAAIETPAADAARQLTKRVKGYPPGIYAVMPEGTEAVTTGPELTDVGVMEGTRLLVSARQLPSPPEADRLALGKFAALMYQRAPNLEKSMAQWGRDFDAATQQALDGLLPGMRSGLSTELAAARQRMVDRVSWMGPRLAAANWFVVRAGAGESFVLGDCPVAASIMFGYDDTWRAIFAEQSFVVAMPINPTTALLVAPQSIVPFGNITTDDATRAINRLIWRSAERYVLAAERQKLEAARPSEVELHTSTIPVDYDRAKTVMAAQASVLAIVTQVMWGQEDKAIRWRGCRRRFGWFPWAAEDRSIATDWPICQMARHPSPPVEPRRT